MDKSGGKKSLKAWQLGGLLVLVVVCGVLFIGAVGGWFSGGRVTLDAEYLCGNECEGDYMELSAEEYETLVEEKKSFVVFVDQNGCSTADKLRGYVSDWAVKNGVRVYRMMFADLKKTTLHDSVKFYPSVAVVEDGKVVAWLRTDAEEDEAAYNDEGEFEKWMDKYVKL